MKHQAFTLSHSFPANFWTDFVSDLSYVGKDANPWIFAADSNHGHSLFPPICHSLEMIPALQITSLFVDGRRITSPTWHPNVKLGFSPVELVSFGGSFSPLRPKPIFWFKTCKAINLRSDFFNPMLSPLLYVCRSPLIDGHGHHVIEASPLMFWRFIYCMRILVLAIIRDMWSPAKVLKNLSLFVLNCSCRCVNCGFGSCFFNAQWSPSSSSIAFKLIIISIILIQCFIVYAAIDRRDAYLSYWTLKLPSTDFRPKVFRILAIALSWVMQLAPVRFIALILSLTSLRLLTVTNLLSFESFEDDLSILYDLTCCIVLLCLCLKALMDF